MSNRTLSSTTTKLIMLPSSSPASDSVTVSKAWPLAAARISARRPPSPGPRKGRAGRDRIARPELAHAHRPAVDVAAGDDLHQLVGQCIGAHHAYRHRAVRAREAPVRPFDVAAELVEERRLDAILVRLRVGLRRTRGRDPCRDPDGESAGAQQSCHHPPIDTANSHPIVCSVVPFHFTYTRSTFRWQ